MRVLSLIIALISVPPLLFLWLPVLRELAASGTAYRDWFAPLGPVLLVTAVILFVLRLADRSETNHRPTH